MPGLTPTQPPNQPPNQPTAQPTNSSPRPHQHQVAHAPHRLVSIRSVDEAVVIGAALSMSSSAFVLQLLRERGEVTSKFGNATLGVLLFQVGGGAVVVGWWG